MTVTSGSVVDQWERIDAYVDALLAEFPAPSEEQKTQVRALMQPTGLSHLPRAA